MMYVKKLRARDIEKYNREWFELYTNYQMYDDRVVKVFKIQNDKMYMEHLQNGILLSEIERLRLLPYTTRRFIFEQMIQIYTNQFYFKHKLLRDEQVFIHADYWLKNLIYTNDRVVLIDADSFLVTSIGDQYMRFSKFLDSVNILQYKLF